MTVYHRFYLYSLSYFRPCCIFVSLLLPIVHFCWRVQAACPDSHSKFVSCVYCALFSMFFVCCSIQAGKCEPNVRRGEANEQIKIGFYATFSSTHLLKSILLTNADVCHMCLYFCSVDAHIPVGKVFTRFPTYLLLSSYGLRFLSMYWRKLAWLIVAMYHSEIVMWTIFVVRTFVSKPSLKLVNFKNSYGQLSAWKILFFLSAE